MRRLQKDQLLVNIYQTRKEMGQEAAACVIAHINDIMRDKPTVNLVFAAAPSQNDVLAALLNSDVDWTRIHAFHMDEYIGLAPDAPQRFSKFLQDAIWDHLPFASVNHIDGSTDPDKECARYAGLLKEYPVDLILCGIGENCHLAFNDPVISHFHEPASVKIVDLDDACRMQQVHDGCFASIEDVPKQAITLTLPVFISAPRIVGVIPSATKADAVYNTLHMPMTEQFPSTLLRYHPNATLFLDAASGELV